MARSWTGVGLVYPSSVTVRSRTSARAPVHRSSRLVCVLRSRPPGRRRCGPGLRPARRPPWACVGAAATAGPARSIPDNASDGARERARSRSARRAGVAVYVHEYAHDAAGDAARGRPRLCARGGGRRSAWIRPGVFKTLVVAVDGRLGIAVVPADAEVDLKARRRRARRPQGAMAAAGRRGAGDGLRAGRDLARWALRRPLPIGRSTRPRSTGRRSTSRPGGAAWRSSSPAADLARLTGGVTAPIARRG